MVMCSQLASAQLPSFAPDTFARVPIPVLVEQIQFSEGIPTDFAREIEQYAYGRMEDSWRFIIVNSETAPVSDTVAPEYIVQINLEPLKEGSSTREIRDSARQVIGTSIHVSAGIKVNLRVTTITTGELLYSREVEANKYTEGRKIFSRGNVTFSDGRQLSSIPRGRSYPMPKTAEEEAELIQREKSRLYGLVLAEWKEQWDQTLYRIFPMRIHITNILERKGKKAQWVQIDAGENFELSKNAYMRVYTQRNYHAMGRTFVRVEDIGWLSVREVGTDSSRAKINPIGRQAVTDALDSGQVVFCRLVSEEI